MKVFNIIGFVLGVALGVIGVLASDVGMVVCGGAAMILFTMALITGKSDG